MKKEYKKPYLIIESFQLDAAIAASCQNGIPENVKAEYTNAGFFFDIGCLHDIDGNEDGICYQGPIPEFIAGVYIDS